MQDLHYCIINGKFEPFINLVTKEILIIPHYIDCGVPKYDMTYLMFVSAVTFNKTVGTSLMLQQIAALFRKRILYMYREWKTFLMWVSNTLVQLQSVF